LTISTYLADVWSATEFGDPALSCYAATQLRKDTRIGVQTMALLSLLMQLVVTVFILSKGLGNIYLYTIVVLGIFSLHILVSAAYVDDVRALHVLGMSFLVIGALAITFLAHRAADLNIGMLAAIVMLFIAIPLVPWALREAIIVIGLTYGLLTTSLISVPGRFSPGSMWVLQTLLFGAAAVVIVIASRNTLIRKQDIRARFELENAHDAMELLSMQDHLTGAWNRRFLDEKFAGFARDCVEKNTALHIAVLDIDDFKGINDSFGHHVGDRILVAVANTIVRALGTCGRLVRMGGDEFLIVYCGDDLDATIADAMHELQQHSAELVLNADRSLTLSVGIAATEPGQLADLDALYKRADRALYSAKQRRPRAPVEQPALTRTGQWKL